MRQREPLGVAERRRPGLAAEAQQRAQLRERLRPRPDVGHAVEEAPGHEGADREEGDELDDRLEGDGRDHALVPLGAVEVPRAEDDGEGRQRQRHQERAVPPPGDAGAAALRAGGQQVIAGGHRLQLQRDVGHDADDGDQRDERGERRALAVAAGDEVGDRGDAVGPGDADHLAHHDPGEQHRQHRPEVDRQEPDPGRRRPPDAAEIGPGGAVDRQRQRVDPGVADHRAAERRPPVGEGGDREEQHQVAERDAEDQRGGDHGAIRRGRPRAAPSASGTLTVVYQ